MSRVESKIPAQDDGKKKRVNTTIAVSKDHAVEDLERANNDITALHLVLKDIVIGEKVAEALISLLRGHGRSWEAVAVDMLRQKVRWESLSLEECTGPQLDAVIAVLISLDNIQSLFLASVRLTAYASSALASLGFSHNLGKLQLDLLDLTTTIPTLCQGLKRNKSLTTCSFSRCGLSDDQLALLIGALENHPELKELKIFGNKCRGKGLAAVTAMLLDDKTKIEVLDLSYQHVVDGDDFDVAWMCSALTQNTSLKSLDMDNDSIDDGHLAHIAAALMKNKTLEELMLNHNKITGEGVSLLAANFSKMKGLKKISMYSNQFGP
jgi:hypothetical protein